MGLRRRDHGDGPVGRLGLDRRSRLGSARDGGHLVAEAQGGRRQRLTGLGRGRAAAAGAEGVPPVDGVGRHQVRVGVGGCAESGERDRRAAAAEVP
jgi:hypothetical protein